MNTIKKISLFILMIPYILKTQTIEHIDEYTFAMIKPYAVRQGKTKEIINMIQQAGFRIIAIEQKRLTTQDVYELYEDKIERRWFSSYLKAMTASPVMIMILAKHNAVAEWDQYKKIIRLQYASICKRNNIVHGSDSLQAAKREISLFFTDI